MIVMRQFSVFVCLFVFLVIQIHVLELCGSGALREKQRPVDFVKLQVLDP